MSIPQALAMTGALLLMASAVLAIDARKFAGLTAGLGFALILVGIWTEALA